VSLAAKVIATPARETSATSGRYRYQAMWGLVHLFEQHERCEDYAIVFELHDDIAFFNSSTDPTTVIFFQVKTKKNGNWTVDSLLFRKKTQRTGGLKQASSIFDKMYDSIEKFGDTVLAVEFVSNQRFTGSSSESFRFSDLPESSVIKILNSIQEVYASATENHLAQLGYRYTDLSLSDTAAHLKGKLQNFIARQVGSAPFSPEAVYTSIAEECRIRADAEMVCTDFEQVVKHKGFSKQKFQEWLDAVRNSAVCPRWEEISPEYNVPIFEKLNIRKEFEAYRSAVLNISDKAMFRVRLAIRQARDSAPEHATGLSDVVAHVVQNTESLAKVYIVAYSLAKLKAMIIYEIYANSEDRAVQATAEELTEEKS
jgi:hypothetical protein